ncbi:hypothetical protein CCHL11_02931 [Colletotrichum chlorophyti]|uniref:Uncharacterized protein n=1 Tax=Colletotrichum chlorophyti TaxID=708187 RepID=A0A1Q8S0W2_9PEZI|nr:hypothetical protein CCHL11_02931 [Colletotrichum chlorophyti]
MCEVFIYKHAKCKCVWGQIAVACAPGMGYSTCEQFGSGVAKRPLKMQMAEKRPCPKHECHGLYDRNQTRMINKITHGVKFGAGPSKQDAGVEVNLGCCSVM